MASTTNRGSQHYNLQGSGGMAGAQQFFNSLPTVPGSVVTRPNGAQTATLVDGSKVAFYPVSSSGGVPTVQIFRPTGSYETTKIRF